MNGRHEIKMAILLAGDIIVAWVSLYLALVLRYGTDNFAYVWELHTHPFLYVYALWFLIFFIVGLYDINKLRGRIALAGKTTEALVAGFLVALSLFYFVPSFRVAPKVSLLAVVAIFAAIFLTWRFAAVRIFSHPRFRSRMLFLGDAPEAAELCETLNHNPHLGYDCERLPATAALAELPRSDVIVVSHTVEGERAAPSLFRSFFAATSILDLPSFYESVRQSIAASALSEQWVIANIARRETGVYDHLKRPLDLLLTLALAVPAIILAPIVALTVRLSGPGPIIFRQDRVGRGGRVFSMLKFRTMRPDAENGGARFAEENDPRVTTVGRFLRTTRLDEIPQLWNILKGEMSFVGPRPERPEMEAKIAESLPLFPVRHMVRPGLTGWAQINAPYAATQEDHLKKLLLDLYYLKYRSFALDVAIILKTVYSVFKRKGR